MDYFKYCRCGYAFNTEWRRNHFWHDFNPCLPLTLSIYISPYYSLTIKIIVSKFHSNTVFNHILGNRVLLLSLWNSKHLLYHNHWLGHLVLWCVIVLTIHLLHIDIVHVLVWQPGIFEKFIKFTLMVFFFINFQKMRAVSYSVIRSVMIHSKYFDLP